MTPPPWGTTVPGNAWDLVADRPHPRRPVSVVLTHFEQPAALARTLHALTRQTLAPVEVVVADDGSATPPEVPAGLPWPVTVVRQEDRGFRAAAARNAGVAATTGEVLVLLDCDTTPEPAYVERLTHLPALLPELVAVGRRRHADLAALPADAVLPDAVRTPLPEPRWLREAYARTRDLRDADETDFRHVVGAVLACSRWWFDEVGGFDGSFVGYGGEDWELAHRAWSAGGLVAHVPAAVAWHDGPDAGESPRTADDGTAEAAAVAARVGVPGVAWRGVLADVPDRPGPVDLVADLAPGLPSVELVVGVDALLAALPRTVVLLDADQLEVLPRAVAEDPRVRFRDGTGARVLDRARLHLRLHRGLLGDDAAYRTLAGACDGPDPAATRCLAGVPDPDAPTAPGREGVLAELRDLRQHRRAARWCRPGLLTEVPLVVPGLRPVPSGARLEAYLGGWV